MKNFIVITLIRRMVGSVNIVANYELNELTFAIRCLVLGREFLHRAWNISGTNVQPSLRAREAVPPCPHMCCWNCKAQEEINLSRIFVFSVVCANIFHLLVVI
jgi:hypothetical protein